jgi:hypothetical protein
LLTVSDSSDPFEEFSRLVRGLPGHQVRLVQIYIIAIALEGEGLSDLWGRLCAVERTLHVSLEPAIRQAKAGLVDTQEIDALHDGFGVSRAWILTGDIAALEARILEFSRS